MLSFAMMMMLAQADAGSKAVRVERPAAPECISASGVRVCGYHCLNLASGSICAQTPDGICQRGEADQARCFDPPLWVKQVYGDKLPAAQCVSHGMNMACGYNCAKDADGVACASTPVGVCVANWGRAICADPPAEVYGVYGLKAPPPTCMARGGLLACGYNCTVGGGSNMGCSRTPFGTCAEKGGGVTCFDPDRYVICAKGTSTPKPQCLYESGAYTCGYACKIAYGIVGCAKTPDGTCNDEGYGKPVCFDPPVRGGDEKCVELIGFK